MHTVVIRNDVYQRDPWVALSMYKALCRAKEHAYHLLADMGSPKVSSAWLQPLIEEEKEIIGSDWYPYGIEANRPTIEALLQYTHEHGLTDRRVKLEELFAPRPLRDIPLSEGQHVYARTRPVGSPSSHWRCQEPGVMARPRSPQRQRRELIRRTRNKRDQNRGGQR